MGKRSKRARGASAGSPAQAKPARPDQAASGRDRPDQAEPDLARAGGQAPVGTGAAAQPPARAPAASEWRASNQPLRYIDEERLARLKPVAAAVAQLGLPLLRYRKINGILNVLGMQIEDGGDSPEVNRLLLAALRAGVLHQVESAREPRAASALLAIDAFERTEASRWEQVRAGTLPPHQPSDEDQLDDLMQEGYRLKVGNRAAACDRWLAAWEMVKRLARPTMRTVRAFDDAHSGLTQSVFNWASDLEIELMNAGLDAPVYLEQRERYAREFLALFPDEEAIWHVNMERARGQALWRLGRRAEAEAVYARLVERFPDEGWAYVGWADEYWIFNDSPKDYDRGEAILQRALARPSLKDRDDVLGRLEELQHERAHGRQRD